MNDAQVSQIALEVLLEHIEKGPRFSQVAAKVPNYTGDGQSLKDAMRIQLEVEELAEDLLNGISQGLKGNN